MLKISSTESTKLRKGGVGVGGNNKAGRGGSEIDKSRIDNIEIDGGEVKVDEVGKKVHKTSKSKNLSKSKKTVRSLDFFTFGAKLAFTKLRQAFLKTLILHHFDPKHYIWIEMDVLGYDIDGVFSQLILDDLG